MRYQLFKNSNFRLLFLLFTATILRFWYIDKTSIGGDECFSLFISQYNIRDIINILSTGDNPPIWEIMLHYWCMFFGNKELSIRLLALIFNVLTIIPIYKIGEKFFGNKNAFLASLLFVLSSFSLFLSHEARVYSLVGFLSTCSMWMFLNFIHSKGRIINLLLLACCNILLLYSHYLSVWILVVQSVVFVLFFKKLNIKFSLMFWYYLLLFAALIPFIPVVYARIMDSGVHGTWVPKVTGIDAIYYMLWGYLNKPVVVVFSGVFILIALLKIVIKKSEINFKYVLIHLWCWFPLIVSFIASFKVSFFLDRYLYFILPGLYYSIILAINYVVNNKKWNLAFSSMLVLFMAVSMRIDSSKMGYSGNHANTKLVTNVFDKVLKDKHTVIISCPNWFEKEVIYYIDRKVFFSKPPIVNLNNVFQKHLIKRNVLLVNSASEIHIKKGIKRIVYFNNDCDFHCTNNQISSFLNDKFIWKFSKVIDGKTLAFYEVKT